MIRQEMSKMRKHAGNMDLSFNSNYVALCGHVAMCIYWDHFGIILKPF